MAVWMFEQRHLQSVAGFINQQKAKSIKRLLSTSSRELSASHVKLGQREES